MLSLSLTILAKSSDLGQMKCLGADACHLTLGISLPPGDSSKAALGGIEARFRLPC